MNTPFLNCNIWSVQITDQPYYEQNFYLVSSVYHYNSLTSGIINFDMNCIQIPEFEIHNIKLLDNLDFNVINENSIPILYRDNNTWRIDLKIYEDYKLQSRNI
jgi:hypothetical protein